MQHARWLLDQHERKQVISVSLHNLADDIVAQLNVPEHAVNLQWVASSGNAAHKPGIGGKVPGSNAGDATARSEST